jgi:putative transposase
MPLQGGLSVERMCQLAQVSRASFYRYLQGGWQSEGEMVLRSAIQNVVIQHRWRYGYRRVAAELRARGMLVNHKRIARMMREDNLLAVCEQWMDFPRRSLRVVRVHVNLASRMTLSGPAADITYIRLACEFVYLAVILDVSLAKSLAGP